MGIDRIGKGGAPPAAPAPETAQKSGAVDKPFSVEKTDAAHKASHAGAIHGSAAPSPLARLRAGEIDVNAYVDLKVDEATKSVQGLPPADLADLKKILREQIATDPGLIDLVKQSAGSTPSEPQD